MSRSLEEHLALAPPHVQDVALGVASLAAVDEAERRRRLAPLAEAFHDDPEFVPGLLDELREIAPPGLEGRALLNATMAIVVGVLGEKHGGHQWARESGHWPKGELG